MIASMKPPRFCIRVVLPAALVLAVSGCALPQYRAPFVPPGGCLISQVKAPLTANFDKTPAECPKSGSASVSYINPYPCIWLPLAFDSCSIQDAARNGGISKVHYADYEYFNVLLIYERLTVTAYGE